MSEILKLRTRGEIDEEAAIWAWRMDSDTVSAADRRAFESWLRRDPRHRRASEELSRVWAALNGLAEAKRDEKIATFAASGFVKRRHRMWWAAAAAGLVLGVAVPAWLQTGSELQTIATAVGQQRNVTLADGSVVTLNTNTIVETNLRRGSREIYLRKGEAHFHVAHDRSRPFLVHAGDAVVRAVGTEFEVRLLTDQHVAVVVNEGRVEVQSAAPGGGPRITDRNNRPPAALRAGQQLSTATADYSVRSVSPQQLSDDMAWLGGAIIFDGKPLAEAVAEIERYTDFRIVVSDPRIAALLVGGRFRTDNVQGFFDALQSALPVSIRRAPDGVVFIDPRR
jgi:transmembrane sensor